MSELYLDVLTIVPLLIVKVPWLSRTYQLLPPLLLAELPASALRVSLPPSMTTVPPTFTTRAPFPWLTLSTVPVLAWLLSTIVSVPPALTVMVFCPSVLVRVNPLRSNVISSPLLTTNVPVVSCESWILPFVSAVRLPSANALTVPRASTRHTANSIVSMRFFIPILLFIYFLHKRYLLHQR